MTRSPLPELKDIPSDATYKTHGPLLAFKYGVNIVLSNSHHDALCCRNQEFKSTKLIKAMNNINRGYIFG
jgi:hypothetical protein